MAEESQDFKYDGVSRHGGLVIALPRVIPLIRALEPPSSPFKRCIDWNALQLALYVSTFKLKSTIPLDHLIQTWCCAALNCNTLANSGLRS